MRIIYLLLTVALLSSCSKKSTPAGDKNDCTRYAIVPISRVEYQADSMVVYFHVNSGCGQFNKFIEKDSANFHIVQVQAVYKGCICTMDIPERSTGFKYRPKAGSKIDRIQFTDEEGNKQNKTIDIIY